jgi:monovalent cation:H+ antiporter-2, CPA2 family
MHSGLSIALVLLATAVVVVWLARKANLPPLLGYLMAGVVIGPFGLGLVPDSKESRYLAEFGVVFLMFSIGLEFSLGKLMAMRSTLFGLGFAQVALSLVMALSAVLLMGLDWKTGVVLGAAFAMSSTAIVVKLMAEKRELETPHGRDIMGVLLFQDLAVVPFLILIPALDAPPDQLAARVGLALVKAAAVLGLLLFFGQKIMRGWFHLVARRQSSELFMLNVLLITLGLAWVTEEAGLSLALGAFVAGMLISETEYRHQVEEDIKAFRDVLLGLFFISIGMLLNLRVVWDNLFVVLFLAIIPMLGKLALIAFLARTFGREKGTAVRIGVGLAQAGEFGFVLLGNAGELKIIDPNLLPLVLAAMVISMAMAPFMIAHSEKLVSRITRSSWMDDDVAVTAIVAKTMRVKKHVIVAGYGRHGQALTRLCKAQSVDTMALDLEPDRVKAAVTAGENVAYGDAARREILIAAGLARASALVVTYADTEAALRILAHVRELRPGLPVIVRTQDEADMEKLIAAGATEVVPDAFENSLMLASHALMMVGIPLTRVVKAVQAQRDSRYQMMRGFFAAPETESDDHTMKLTQLHSVRLEEGMAAVGETLQALDLASCGLDVVSVRRAASHGASHATNHPTNHATGHATNHTTEPGANTSQAAPLQVGDVVVLRGLPAAMAKADARLRKR